MATGSKVFTIPPGESFADQLAAGLLDRHGGDAMALGRLTLLLPTRRGIRAVRDGFLRQTGGRAMLLPRMRAIGDIDEDELLLDPLHGDDLLALPPAVTALRRQLLLLHLIARNRDIDPAQAAPLARELAGLLDRLQTENVPLSALDGLVPDDLAAHWQETLDFLNLLATPWQALLAAEGCMDPSERRNEVLAAQARRWRQTPPADPIVIAGSTGSVPATADLMAVVAHLDNGAVVLPGLDQYSDATAWAAVDESHGQFGLRQLLRRLGVTREQVTPWRGDGGESPRQILLREALRPTETTEAWQHLRRRPTGLTAAAATGLVRVDCADPIEEAGVIALCMRRALETPGRTAALVTPDRGLARRVGAELKRWRIAVDDSAGQPLAATPPGSFLRLTAAMLASALDPIDFLAALKHPLALCGRDPGAMRGAVRDLDRFALRGPRPAPGFDGIAAALGAARDRQHRAEALLDELSHKGAAALALCQAPETTLVDLLGAHVGFAEWLATDPGGQCHLWAGEAGEAAMAFVAELLAAATALPAMAGAGYGTLLNHLMAANVVRPAYGLHPRLHIWGPLEARLQRADLLLLGGLNEGTWPAAADADAWLSRPMAAKLGLPAPERRIGLAAHDFAQAACGDEVVLTRAAKVDGTPTVPSRWLLRLEQVLTVTGLTLDQGTPRTWRGWHAQLDEAGPPAPIAAPECRPPVAARPRKLSVTQVETWIRDPYGIYARHILGLRALDPLAADPGAADYGIAVHKSLDQFAATYPRELPADALAALLAMGREAFGELLGRPGVRAFWWPRFERIAAWFLDQEGQRRPGILPVATEARGSLILAGPAGPFELTAVADRIDRLADGRLCIIDYKTGVVPSEPELKRGEAPQLPLEAAIAMAGGFAAVPAGDVAQLSYWRVSGGREAGRIKNIKAQGGDLAGQAQRGLIELIAKFDARDTAYLARPRPAIAPRYSDYDHLARVKEWSAGGPGDY